MYMSGRDAKNHPPTPPNQVLRRAVPPRGQRALRLRGELHLRLPRPRVRRLPARLRPVVVPLPRVALRPGGHQQPLRGSPTGLFILQHSKFSFKTATAHACKFLKVPSGCLEASAQPKPGTTRSDNPSLNCARAISVGFLATESRRNFWSFFFYLGYEKNVTLVTRRTLATQYWSGHHLPPSPPPLSRLANTRPGACSAWTRSIGRRTVGPSSGSRPTSRPGRRTWSNSGIQEMATRAKQTVEMQC